MEDAPLDPVRLLAYVRRVERIARDGNAGFTGEVPLAPLTVGGTQGRLVVKNGQIISVVTPT